MKKLHILLLLLITFSFLFLVGCTNESDEELEKRNDPDGIVTDESEVFYDPDIKEIMTANCIVCHGEDLQNAGVKLTTFALVKNNAETGNMIARMNNAASPMPPSGKLTDNTLKKIDLWVKNNFPEKKQ